MERIRVQCEVNGLRVWVACDQAVTIGELAGLCGAAYEKHTSKPVTVGALSLRGGLLDLDERVGDWISDQELLYAESANDATAEGMEAKAAGVLVAHEAPLNSEGLDLKALEPQVIVMAVLGAEGVGKSSFVGSFAGDKSVEDGSVERKMEVDGVPHKMLLVDGGGREEDVLRSANAFLFLFDCSSRASFQLLQSRLLGQFVAARGHEPGCPVAICCHKADVTPRQVTPAEAIQLAKELQGLCKGSVAVFESSVAGGTNPPVQDTFLNVLQYRCQAVAAAAADDGGSCVVN